MTTAAVSGLDYRNHEAATGRRASIDTMNVPEAHRPAIRALLDQLVAGDIPEMLTWVHQYGRDGAVLIPQPEDIWTHPESHVGDTWDGRIWVEVPLWTTEECDLIAEIDIAVDGTAQLHDVHVL